MNAKLTILLLLVSASIFWGYAKLHDKDNTSIDSLRAQVEESKAREQEATKARMEREDSFSKALYLECFNQTTSQTGSRFDTQQKEAYECWRTKTNGTGNLAPASEPPSRPINTNKQAYDSHNDASKIRPDSQRTSGTGSKIRTAPKTNGNGLATTVQSRGTVQVASAVNKGGSPVQKGTNTICPKKIILRKGWNDPRVQHGYNISCGDMDFIKTIEAESKWDVNASGDSHKAFGLCQINKLYNPEMQKQYRALKTDNEKVEFCYAQYFAWKKRGVIQTRLYGYNVRNLPQNNSFTFK